MPQQNQYPTSRWLANEVVIFKDRIRVDVQTRTPGIDFEDARRRSVTIDVEGVPVHLLSIEDLIASKRAAARERDLQDVEALERLRGKTEAEQA